jgi:hypothetical protein
MNLMAWAQVLSPERDSPYLWIVCRCWVEVLMTTLPSATPSWLWVLIRPLSFPIPEISYVGSFVSHFCSCEA